VTLVPSQLRPKWNRFQSNFLASVFSFDLRARVEAVSYLLERKDVLEVLPTEFDLKMKGLSFSKDVSKGNIPKKEKIYQISGDIRFLISGASFSSFSSHLTPSSCKRRKIFNLVIHYANCVNSNFLRDLK